MRLIGPWARSIPMRRTAPSPASRKATAAVDALLEVLQHPHKPGIEHLRRAILGVDSRIREEVKWNAPSFRLQDHFATFKLYPSSSIQVVLHTGAKPQKPPRKFSLEGAGGLVKWAAPDRCIVTVANTDAAHDLGHVVASLVAQWIRQL